MAISGKLQADFATFYDACQKSEVSLRSFETGAAKVETSLNRVANSLSGTKLIQDATLMTEAVARVGGASTLTAKEQARVNTTVSEAIEKYTALGQQAPAAMVALEQATRSAEVPTTALSVAVGTLAAQIVTKASRAFIDYGTEALLTSAKVESLGGVARFMGQQAGFTATEIDALVQALRRQGITSEAANNAVIQMVRANLSLADATKLATVAQSLARATGENSSATLSKLIQGTQTLQVEVLRNAGVVIQLDQEYKKFAATNDRTVQSLGAQEKQQIALAAVLREGERVAGVYGVTNEFVGGKIQSMTRHQEEAAKAIGDVFKPALVVGVDVLTGFLKVVQEAPALFGGLGIATVGLATAFTTLKGAAALGLISTSALTTGLGLLWPAVAIGATAFAAWQLGKWIGEISGLTDVVERLAGRMMGLSKADIEAGMSARKFAESSAGKAAALAAEAAAVTRVEQKSRAAEQATRDLAQAETRAAEVTAANAGHLDRLATTLSSKVAPALDQTAKKTDTLAAATQDATQADEVFRTGLTFTSQVVGELGSTLDATAAKARKLADDLAAAAARAATQREGGSFAVPTLAVTAANRGDLERRLAQIEASYAQFPGRQAGVNGLTGVTNAEGWSAMLREQIEYEGLKAALASASFAGGTQGFQDFGSGTPAMLHGWEKITPLGRDGGGTIGAITFNLYGTPESLVQQVKAVVLRDILHGRKVAA